MSLLKYAENELDLIGMTKECQDGDPEFQLWREIFQLRSAIRGPDNFETWQDLAVSLKMQLRKQAKAEELLYDLFYALDNANISSWQTTHYWSKELEAAREYFIKKLESEE